MLITTNLLVIKYTVDLKKITDSRNQCIICKEPTYSFLAYKFHQLLVACKNLVIDSANESMLNLMLQTYGN